MRLRVARGNHRLEFGGVFAEIVPERSERGGLRRTPHLSKSPGQQRGRTKVFFKVVRRSVALTTVSDCSAGDDHWKVLTERMFLIRFSLSEHQGRVEIFYAVDT